MNILKADKAREMTIYAKRRQQIIDQISMELMTANCNTTEGMITADISLDYLENEDSIMGNYLAFGRHGNKMLIAPMPPTMQIIEAINKKITATAETGEGSITETIPIPIAILKYLEIIYQAAGYAAIIDNNTIHIAWKGKQ